MIRTHNLSKHFGALRAVNDVNFAVEPGERRLIIACGQLDHPRE